MLRTRILLGLFAAGLVPAVLAAVYRGPILALVFGRSFLVAAPLLLLLCWSIPLDFLTSYLSNAYIAWGLEKKVLVCTSIAAGAEVLLNLIWIPRYGAKAAAVNTLISYGVFLACLALAGRALTARTRQSETDRVEIIPESW